MTASRYDDLHRGVQGRNGERELEQRRRNDFGLPLSFDRPSISLNLDLEKKKNRRPKFATAPTSPPASPPLQGTPGSSQRSSRARSPSYPSPSGPSRRGGGRRGKAGSSKGCGTARGSARSPTYGFPRKLTATARRRRRGRRTGERSSNGGLRRSRCCSTAGPGRRGTR